MCGRERTHLKVLKLLEPLYETNTIEEAHERYLQLLQEAKSGRAGVGCLKSFASDDVLLSMVNSKLVFSTPQSRKLDTSIGKNWYSTLRSLL